jgi:hypothetical protein
VQSYLHKHYFNFHPQFDALLSNDKPHSEFTLPTSPVQPTPVSRPANISSSLAPPRDLSEIWDELQSLRELVLSNINQPQPPQLHDAVQLLPQLHDYIRSEIARNNDHITQQIIRPEIAAALEADRRLSTSIAETATKPTSISANISPWAWASPSRLQPKTLPIPPLEIRQGREPKRENVVRGNNRLHDVGEDVENMLVQLTQTIRHFGNEGKDSGGDYIQKKQTSKQRRRKDGSVRIIGAHSGSAGVTSLRPKGLAGLATKPSPSYTRPTVSFLSKSKI